MRSCLLTTYMGGKHYAKHAPSVRYRLWVPLSLSLQLLIPQQYPISGSFIYKCLEHMPLPVFPLFSVSLPEMTNIAWLPVSAFLFLNLLFARKVCSYIAGWLSYLLLVRPFLKRQQTKGTTKLTSGKLQVIVCGFPRTGTMSLMEALGMLGFPCLHGSHLQKPTIGNLFVKAFKHGNAKDWEKLLDGYASVADFPATCAYKQLIRMYPRSKVILNVRNPDQWFESFQTLVAAEGEYTVFKVVPPLVSKCIKILYHEFFNDKALNKEVCISAYLQHIKNVKLQVEPTKLLVYDIDQEDGWSVLCEFLHVPVPKIPFPRTNDRKQLNMLITMLARLHAMVLSMYVTFVSGILFYLLRWNN